MMIFEDLGINDEALEELQLAVSYIESVPDMDSAIVRVISHYDSDGLSAAAIIARTLYRMGKQFIVDIRHQITKSAVEDIILNDPLPMAFIFSDLGSGVADEIIRIEEERPVVILDHHISDYYRSTENVVHINFRKWGLDGGHDICGATTAMLFSLAAGDENMDLLPIAIAGAYGDKQHLNGWTGVNSTLVRYGLENDYLTEKPIPPIFGRNVSEAIERSNDPFFLTLHGNMERINEILDAIGIPRDTDPARLQDLEEWDSKLRKLNSILILELLRADTSPEIAMQLAEKRLFGGDKSIAPGVDIENLNHIINACGRRGMYALGLRTYFGDDDAYNLALSIREEYRNEIRRILVDIARTKESVKERGYVHGRIYSRMENVHVIYLPPGYESMCGAITGIARDYILGGNMPAIGLAPSEDGSEIKVSGRASNLLVSRGIDLATVLAKASSLVGGHGGGHQVAAGATIPADREKVEEFVRLVDELIGRQKEGMGDES